MSRMGIIVHVADFGSGELGDAPHPDGIPRRRLGTRGKRGQALIILLAGGDKSTQAKDIKTALRLA